MKKPATYHEWNCSRNPGKTNDRGYITVVPGSLIGITVVEGRRGSLSELTPEQARELAAALIRAAEIAESVQ